MAFLRRSNAKPVSLLSETLNSGLASFGASSSGAPPSFLGAQPSNANHNSNQYPMPAPRGGAAGAPPPPNPSVAGGGIGVGKAVLLRAHADSSRAREAAKAYLHALVAHHIVAASAASSPSSAAGVSGVGSNSGDTAARWWDAAVSECVNYLLATLSTADHPPPPKPFRAAVVWVVAPGAPPLDAPMLLSSLRSCIVAELLGRFGVGLNVGTLADSQQAFAALDGQLSRFVTRAFGGGSPAGGLPTTAEITDALVVAAASCVDVSHPSDAAEFVHAIATAKVTPPSSSSSSSPAAPAGGVAAGASSLLFAKKFPFAMGAGAASSASPASPSSPQSAATASAAATPLVILDGLGTNDSSLATLERQVGAEVPLRWALETLAQTQHAAFVVTETFTSFGGFFGGGGGGGGGWQSRSSTSSHTAIPPSHAHDLRKDSFFVQNLTSRWAMAVPPTVAGRLAQQCADRHGAAANANSRRLPSSPTLRTPAVAAPPVKVEGGPTVSSSFARPDGSGSGNGRASGGGSGTSALPSNSPHSPPPTTAAQRQRQQEERRLRLAADLLSVMLTGCGASGTQQRFEGAAEIVCGELAAGTSVDADVTFLSSSSSSHTNESPVTASFYGTVSGFVAASLQAVLTFTAAPAGPSVPTTAGSAGAPITALVTLSTVAREVVLPSSSYGGGGGGTPQTAIIATPKFSVPMTVDVDGFGVHAGGGVRWGSYM